MLRDLFVKDFGWKLFSLLLAAFIWYTVHKIIEEPKAAPRTADDSRAFFDNLPVSLVGNIPDAELYRVNSNNVSVTVSGPSDAINLLQKVQLHAYLNLAGLENPDKESYEPVDVAVPWGITVIDVQPAKLRVIPPPKH